jgi:stage III sporulation protein AE
MKYWILSMILILALAQPVSALEIRAPSVPRAGEEWMPEQTGSFGDGLWELLRKAVQGVRPDLTEASGVCAALMAAVLMLSVLESFSGSLKNILGLGGTVAITTILLGSAHSMIRLGGQTVTELSEYGKLLLPVMTAAMAAQGGITASAALYTGTAVFNTFLTRLICVLFVPMVYLFLALASGNGATGEDLLKQLRDMVKNAVSWCLKTMLMVFTTYMGITGVVSGTTDAAALKATRVTISSVVPVVGGILSDASEAVLVSAGLVKNAAGIYGILATLAVFLHPFLKIGVHYLMLKATAAVCGIFGPQRMSGLIADYATALGLLLAMTGSVCLLLLISTVCFLKGVG